MLRVTSMFEIGSQWSGDFRIKTACDRISDGATCESNHQIIH